MITATHEQAIKAISLIMALIDQAFPDGQKYTATQMNVHPSTVKEMYELVEEIRNNP